MKFNIINSYIKFSSENNGKSKHISEAVKLRDEVIHLAMRYFCYETCETANPISKFLGFEICNDAECKRENK